MQVLFDDAVEDYTKAIQFDRTLAVAYYNRGTIYYRMGCFGDALKDLKTAVELEPSNNEFINGFKACEKML
ncbi:Tetratricopeptide repeat protein 32 [Armadillidium vulgare]|nr:Tetratricopeptide repeat protein 32 [Armadillidium vulgare]